MILSAAVQPIWLPKQRTAYADFTLPNEQRVVDPVGDSRLSRMMYRAHDVTVPTPAVHLFGNVKSVHGDLL